MAGRGFEPRCKGNETRRFAKAWKGLKEQGKATAMYARRSID